VVAPLSGGSPEIPYGGRSPANNARRVVQSRLQVMTRLGVVDFLEQPAPKMDLCHQSSYQPIQPDGAAPTISFELSS